MIPLLIFIIAILLLGAAGLWVELLVVTEDRNRMADALREMHKQVARDRAVQRAIDRPVRHQRPVLVSLDGFQFKGRG